MQKSRFTEDVKKTCFSKLQFSAKDKMSIEQRRYVMKCYGELKAEMETIKQQMAEAKNKKCADTRKEVKRFYKDVWLYGWDTQRFACRRMEKNSETFRD